MCSTVNMETRKLHETATSAPAGLCFLYVFPTARLLLPASLPASLPTPLCPGPSATSGAFHPLASPWDLTNARRVWRTIEPRAGTRGVMGRNGCCSSLSPGCCWNGGFSCPRG